MRLAQKAEEGKRRLEVVWPSWFHVSASRWARQDEALYRISPSENTLASANAAEALTADSAKDAAKASNGGPDAAADKAAVEDAGEALFEHELNDMDWGAAADEVDAYLDSATTASNTSSPSPSMLANDADLPDITEDHALADAGTRRKRSRADDDDDANSESGAGDAAKKPRPEAVDGNTDDDDDDFLDDLANELDGQLDDE